MMSSCFGEKWAAEQYVLPTLWERLKTSVGSLCSLKLPKPASDQRAFLMSNASTRDVAVALHAPALSAWGYRVWTSHPNPDPPA